MSAMRGQKHSFSTLKRMFLWTYSYKHINVYTVKPVCYDHLYDEIYYLWFIQ